MPLSKIVKMAGIAGLAASLVGCATAPIPLAENFELTVQKKVRSAGHWEILARDIIAQTSATLEKSGVSSTSELYVAEPANASAFDKAFRQFLITELVEGGKLVKTKPEGAIEVSYDTLVIKHRSPRPHFIPGKYTMLASGLAALYGVSGQHLDVKIATGIALAAGADYVASVDSGGPTHTELVLTTTVTNAGRYLARKTDVYYLENEDAFLFARALRSKVMEVVAQ
jgi:hypothetical protein